MLKAVNSIVALAISGNDVLWLIGMRPCKHVVEWKSIVWTIITMFAAEHEDGALTCHLLLVC